MESLFIGKKIYIMKQLNLFSIILNIILVVALIYVLKHKYATQTMITNPMSTSETVIGSEKLDTSKIKIYHDIKEIPKYYAIHDTVQIKGDTLTDTIRVPYIIDGKLTIPITQKIYRDKRYEAYVSGYHSKLDSLRIFSVKKNLKKWSIGITTGIGITNNMKLGPYIGIGVSYKLVDF